MANSIYIMEVKNAVEHQMSKVFVLLTFDQNLH
jgi:hypothetical protein